MVVYEESRVPILRLVKESQRTNIVKVSCESLCFLLRGAADTDSSVRACLSSWGQTADRDRLGSCFQLEAPECPRVHPHLLGHEAGTVLSTNRALTQVAASREMRIIINKCKKS